MVGAVGGQRLLVNVHRDAQILGDLPGVVDGAGVDEDDLVEQRHVVHQRLAHGADHLADGLLLVERRQPQGDGDALLFFRLQQPLHVL